MMNSPIRPARSADAPAMLALKESLRLRPGRDSAQGGFLLGSDLDGYRALVELGLAHVAERDGQLLGFGIVLPDKVLRASELWQKRHLARWDIDLAPLEREPVCYFDQLAFRPCSGRLPLLLAYGLAARAFGMGHRWMLATTVREPLLNPAALPFLEAAGGRLVGQIEEHYPGQGRILSDLHLLERDQFFQRAQAHPLFALLRDR